MRIRQVKPGFWTDSTMAGLPYSTRLFYIGLWMLADDAGWLRWNVAQAGAELYPFESVKRRERDLTDAMRRLSECGRVVVHDCGHAQVPHLTQHQHVSSRPVYTVRDEHRRDCARMFAEDRESAPSKGKGKGKGEGRVSKGEAESSTSEFRERVPEPQETTLNTPTHIQGSLE